MQEQWGSEFEFRLGHGWIRNVILTGKLSLGVNRPDAKKAHERVVACCTQS